LRQVIDKNVLYEILEDIIVFSDIVKSVTRFLKIKVVNCFSFI